MIELIAEDVTATHHIAGRLALGLADQGSVLIGLSGELGAGKTEFVRGFMEALGPDRARTVCSPTYAIAQTYAGDPEVRHLDLYRLGGLGDLESIGYRELYFAEGFTLVEWIRHVPEAIPPDWVEIELAHRGSDGREIRICPYGDRLNEAVRAIFDRAPQ